MPRASPGPSRPGRLPRFRMPASGVQRKAWADGRLNPTITSASPAIAFARLRVPPGRKPRPWSPWVSVQRKASPSDSPTTTMPSLETSRAWPTSAPRLCVPPAAVHRKPWRLMNPTITEPSPLVPWTRTSGASGIGRVSLVTREGERVQRNAFPTAAPTTTLPSAETRGSADRLRTSWRTCDEVGAA